MFLKFHFNSYRTYSLLFIEYNYIFNAKVLCDLQVLVQELKIKRKETKGMQCQGGRCSVEQRPGHWPWHFEHPLYPSPPHVLLLKTGTILKNFYGESPSPLPVLARSRPSQAWLQMHHCRPLLDLINQSPQFYKVQLLGADIQVQEALGTIA
jgi:hypothetical protein